jgi:transposase, IS5 family
MRPKKPETTGEGDLVRARLEQIINLKHELVQLGGKIDWDWVDREIAPLYSEKGRPGIESRFVIGLLLLKQIYGLSDEDVCERWVYDPYFQHFTGEEFFQHEFPHERSDISHWRKRLGDKLELLLAESLRVAHETGALRTRDLKRPELGTGGVDLIDDVKQLARRPRQPVELGHQQDVAATRTSPSAERTRSLANRRKT